MASPARDFYEREVLAYEGNKCLFWPHSTNNKGRGRIRIDGKTVYVHRRVCEEVNGPPPTPEHEAAHSCGKGHLACVTKRHLRWATHKENKADELVHGTRARGERNGRAKLSEAQVKQIRQMRGAATKTDIGQKFGVCLATVSLIHSEKIWKEE